MIKVTLTNGKMRSFPKCHHVLVDAIRKLFFVKIRRGGPTVACIPFSAASIVETPKAGEFQVPHNGHNGKDGQS